jgi:transcriptional regulator with XRE-family HTH domain
MLPKEPPQAVPPETVMAKKAENPTPHSHEQSLGQFLRSHRQARRLTLREVEEASGVSNPYLSQLENDKIAEPSPPILHKLAPAYGVPYETLMEKAGYLSKKPEKAPEGTKRRGGLAAFAKDELTPEEEEALVEYLAFLRSRKPKK